ncbi:DUF779 domain-containing protein [Streptomyces justiciae]|uniref:DUF779 domain-containing protein n=1 Tax=Streptomyces justiciae TaxID=2780140 RepID=UPI002119AFC5|nr:DUF779 domain-containing protein [Streptomyces justiciae]MCW8376129.1 DUF779 domain-containing protein [Streptomyces justiciae]
MPERLLRRKRPDVLPGEFAVGEGDMLVGVVAGCTFHMNADQYESLGRPFYVLDVEAGTPGCFSLAAGDGLRFVTRVKAPRCHTS